MFGEYWSPNQSMYYSSYTKSFIKTKVKQKNIHTNTNIQIKCAMKFNYLMKTYH